jgi:hypothetical protein
MAERKYSIGQMLMKSLTSDQIANLLTIVSALTDLNIYMEKFEKIDPDMAMTVKKNLDADQDSSDSGNESKTSAGWLTKE